MASRPFGKMLATIGAFFGVTAAGLHLLGYALYLRALLRDHIKPNATSWLLWSGGSVLSVAIYSQNTKDMVLLILPAVCAVASVGIVAVVAVRGALRRLDGADCVALVFDLAVVAVWVATENARLAYAALLLDIAVTFVPIWRSTAQSPEGEQPLPWIIWSLAYAVMAMAVACRWDGWMPLLFPLVYLIAHGGVAILAAQRPVQPTAGLA